MSEMSMQMRVLFFEMQMGSSHECRECGHVFLAHSDGCPRCGSYNISSLHENDIEKEEWDMESFPVRVFDPDDILVYFNPINIGDFSPYPRT